MKTGVVRFGYLHLVYQGRESEWAAQASECADEQGSFWPYHDLLYQRQDGVNRGAFAQDRLRAMATELGLLPDPFAACLGSGRYAGQITRETNAAVMYGIRSTPTFLVNGRPVQGALPFEQFRELIDEARLSTGG